MYCVKSVSNFTKELLKKHYKWSFSYNSIVKFHGTKNREQQHEHVVSRGCGVL